MISHNLKTAIDETIQAHADRNHHGKVDLERVLSAIGDVSTDYLAQVPNVEERRTLWWLLINGIVKALGWKLANQGEATRSRQ